MLIYTLSIQESLVPAKCMSKLIQDKIHICQFVIFPMAFTTMAYISNIVHIIIGLFFSFLLLHIPLYGSSLNEIGREWIKSSQENPQSSNDLITHIIHGFTNSILQ